MARGSSYIQVVNLKELNRAVRRAVDSDLPKRMGQANKRIGELIIRRLSPRPDPRAVGEGRGASVRASASNSRVQLRVGGSHRPKPPLSVWGARRVGGIGPAPARPHIQGTAQAHYDEITGEWLEAIGQALSPAFHEVDM